MKTVLALITVAAMATLAPAQMKMGHPISKNAKHVMSCPVTGDKVDVAKATKSHMYADYKGNRYFFCCGDCPSQFKKNPAKFAKKPHMKTPKSP